MMRSLERALHRAGRNGMLAVAGGKGGVGTSTIAGLLAVAASEAGDHVLLVDGDPAFGTQHLLFDLPAGPGLAGVRRGALDPRSLPVSVRDGLMLVPGGLERGPAGTPRAAELEAIFRRISSLCDRFDMAFIDAGSRSASLAPLLRAGVGGLIVVSRPDRISVAASYALLKYAFARRPEIEVRVIVNGADEAVAARSFRTLVTAVEGFLHRELRLAGAIPEDSRLAALVASGESLAGSAADGVAGAAARRALRRIQGRSRGSAPAAGRVAVPRA